MNYGNEAGVGFIVARRDAPKLLEPLEAVLDQVPPFVHCRIVRDRRFAIRLGGNDGDGTAFIQRGSQTIVVEALVGNERFEIDILNQRIGADTIMTLARKQDEASKIAQCVGERHDFGRQAATVENASTPRTSFQSRETDRARGRRCARSTKPLPQTCDCSLPIGRDLPPCREEAELFAPTARCLGPYESRLTSIFQP